MGTEARQAGSSKVVREGGCARRELLFQTGLMLARSEQGQGEATGNLAWLKGESGPLGFPLHPTLLACFT